MAGMVNNFILMGQLEQLYKGGRMNGVQFFIGSLLKVKPIVQISKEGKLEAIDKVRSEKRALHYLIDKVAAAHKNGITNFYLMQGNIPEQAENLRKMIIEQMPTVKIEIMNSVRFRNNAGEGNRFIVSIVCGYQSHYCMPLFLIGY